LVLGYLWDSNLHPSKKKKKNINKWLTLDKPSLQPKPIFFFFFGSFTIFIIFFNLFGQAFFSWLLVLEPFVYSSLPFTGLFFSA
jgi:hypothetical protein